MLIMYTRYVSSSSLTQTLLRELLEVSRFAVRSIPLILLAVPAANEHLLERLDPPLDLPGLVERGREPQRARTEAAHLRADRCRGCEPDVQLARVHRRDAQLVCRLVHPFGGVRRLICIVTQGLPVSERVGVTRSWLTLLSVALRGSATRRSRSMPSSGSGSRTRPMVRW